MEEKVKKEILENLGLFMEDVTRKIRHVETQKLDYNTISKRHIRIMQALLPPYERVAAFCLHTLEHIQNMVAQQSNKRYPLGDIRSFLMELTEQEYVVCVQHEEYGDVFGILHRGRLALKEIKRQRPKLCEPSNTPNFYVGIRH